jgi:hypothetical protein
MKRALRPGKPRGKLGRRQVAQARMQPHLVIVPPPRLDHRFRLSPGAEPLEAQALGIMEQEHQFGGW